MTGFFFELAQMYVVFPFYFFCRPLYIARLSPAQGAAPKQNGDPRGGRVGQRPKKDQIQNGVFELPSSRNAQKRE
jgi:hypothetical protein